MAIDYENPEARIRANTLPPGGNSVVTLENAPAQIEQAEAAGEKPQAAKRARATKSK